MKQETEHPEISMTDESLNQAFRTEVDNAIAAIKAIESAVRVAARIAINGDQSTQVDDAVPHGIGRRRRIKPEFQIRFVAEQEIALKKMRSTYFPNAVLEDAGWNIMLDLFLQQQLGRDVSITSSCLASGVPPTTALRWIDVLENEGMITREDDACDKRRRFVRLSQQAYDAMTDYLFVVAESRYRLQTQLPDFGAGRHRVPENLR